jgi:hypothetical protein
MSQLEAGQSDVIVIQADKEHGGIQFTVPLIMLVGGILVYLVVDSWLLHPLLGGGDYDSFRPFLRIVLSIILGVAIGGVAESIMKRTWVSGRQLTVDPDGLTIEDKDLTPAQIDWDKRVNLLCWKYPLRGYPRGGRERRVPGNYYLLACRLLQDDSVVVAYCFADSKEVDQVPGHTGFVGIDMAELYGKGPLGRFSQPVRPTIPAHLLSGRQGQVWAAEKQRWSNGFELDPDDFFSLMAAVERHVVRPQA